MDLETTLKVATDSSQETEHLAEQIGKNAKGGEVIELTSDLGGGKTTFVRGLSRGVGSEDVVSSPSFTISKVYKTEKVVNGKIQILSIQHFDFYRVGEKPELMAHELSDALQDKNNIVVLEWAAVVSSMLPAVRMQISIEKQDENSRMITIRCPIQLFYLLDGINAKAGRADP